MGTVDVNSGEYEVFDSHQNWDNWSNLTVASGAAPGYFPPEKVFDKLWMDGGSAYNLELPALVEHCRKQGFTDEQIKLDVILLSPTKSIKLWETPGRTGEMNYWRAHEIRSLKRASAVLEGFMRANPLIGYRYLVKPETKLIYEVNFVDFKPKRSQKLIDAGAAVAMEVISAGEGVTFTQFKDSLMQ